SNQAVSVAASTPATGAVKPAVISGTEVKSPIIGTAYLAAEPGAKKFAEVGKKIKKGETVMIVEAMKTMNHVPSTVDGIIKEICVEDGQPVEYGQTIIIVE
ncbi:acetyl-CoA carboxylase biotin carboxyl carrier protein subunit, partial [Candidatus Pelagibacter bacterium]|nr:acetyl-CoA carboxylase biotin carboxyl carrier protein subunit [Candidatus Pelagibacter bacterium]